MKETRISSLSQAISHTDLPPINVPPVKLMRKGIEKTSKWIVPTLFINFKIFLPWDLTFGSGMQALGSLLAVITAAWCIKRSESLKELSEGKAKPFSLFLYWWIRIVVPTAILFVGINWLLEYVFNIKIFG